jgi:hypothetical protein
MLSKLKDYATQKPKISLAAGLSKIELTMAKGSKENEGDRNRRGGSNSPT